MSSERLALNACFRGTSIEETTADYVISTNSMQVLSNPKHAYSFRFVFSYFSITCKTKKKKSMNSNENYDPSLGSLEPLIPPRKPRTSFVEENNVPSSAPPQLPPRLVEQPATPPATSTSRLDPSIMNDLTRRKQRAFVADTVPDLHGLLPSSGLDTELDTHDTELTREAVTAAEKKSMPATSDMPGTFKPPNSSVIPEWYRTGWISMSSAENPGGVIQSLKAQYKRSMDDPLDEMLPSILYGEWYHNSAALFVTAIVSFVLAKMNAGLGTIVLFCLFIGIVNMFHYRLTRV